MAYARAFSTLGCPDFTLEETLALAERHGIDAVELRALGGSLELPAYFEKHYGTPAALAEKLRGQHVRIVSLSTSLHVIGGLADAWISYMLPPEEYRKGGYESSVSFYGETLGETMVNGAIESFVRAAAIELPQHRINAVSPTVLEESLATYGSYFRGFEAVPAKRAALAFSKSIEGSQTGQIYSVV